MKWNISESLCADRIVQQTAEFELRLFCVTDFSEMLVTGKMWLSNVALRVRKSGEAINCNLICVHKL